MYYFELPFGLCLTYSQWTWLGWNWGEGRLLAQRFPQDSWESCWHYLSGKLLLSWTKWWPIFPQYLGYVPPLPLPTPCLYTCMHTGQLSLYSLLSWIPSLGMCAYCVIGTLRTCWTWKIFRLKSCTWYPGNTARKDSVPPVLPCW